MKIALLNAVEKNVEDKSTEMALSKPVKKILNRIQPVGFERSVRALGSLNSLYRQIICDSKISCSEIILFIREPPIPNNIQHLSCSNVH